MTEQTKSEISRIYQFFLDKAYRASEELNSLDSFSQDIEEAYCKKHLEKKYKSIHAIKKNDSGLWSVCKKRLNEFVGEALIREIALTMVSDNQKK